MGEHKKIILTVPNVLTFLRFVMVIMAIAEGVKNHWGNVLVLAVLAAITDWLDGWIARKYESRSILGKALDPIADKFFLSLLFVINPWVCIMVLSLEVSGMYFSNAIRKRTSDNYFIANGSKGITFIQMTLAIILILNRLEGLVLLQNFEREIFGALITLSLCRLLIYSSIWKK